MKHNNDFRFDLEFGKQGESMLHKMLSNEEGFNVEVKRDRQAYKTNNLYFEYQSRGKPSGLATTEAKYYAYFVTDTFCFIISVMELKMKLKRLVKEDKAIGNMPGGDKNTSLGVLVSIDNFLKE